MCLSALAHEPEACLVILLVDAKREVKVRDSRVHIVWAEDLGFTDYLKCAFKYNIIELNTALKPHAALRLLERFDRVIYLDPDICVYAPLASVHQALEKDSFALTPHALSPYSGEGKPGDQDLLRFGAFNLGFFAARADSRSRAILKWWDERCRELCYYEPQSGLGVDQKWMDLAPAFFEGTILLRDPGLNVAFWNLHERKLSCVNGQWLVNGDLPLCFVHFSSFVDDDAQAIAGKQTRYAPGSRPDFSAAGQVYRNYLARATQAVELADTQYAYASFADGHALSPALRRFYAMSSHPAVTSAANPFTSSAVLQFARNNRLLTQGPAMFGPATFKQQGGYARQQAFIGIMFRLALRILGPDRYFFLLRYLSNYTSILNQQDIALVLDQRLGR